MGYSGKDIIAIVIENFAAVRSKRSSSSILRSARIVGCLVAHPAEWNDGNTPGVVNTEGP